MAGVGKFRPSLGWYTNFQFRYLSNPKIYLQTRKLKLREILGISWYPVLQAWDFPMRENLCKCIEKWWRLRRFGWEGPPMKHRRGIRGHEWDSWAAWWEKTSRCTPIWAKSFNSRFSILIFSRVLRDCTTRYVGPLVGRSIGWSFFYFFGVFELFKLTAPAQIL